MVTIAIPCSIKDIPGFILGRPAAGFHLCGPPFGCFTVSGIPGSPPPHHQSGFGHPFFRCCFVNLKGDPLKVPDMKLWCYQRKQKQLAWWKTRRRGREHSKGRWLSIAALEPTCVGWNPDSATYSVCVIARKLTSPQLISFIYKIGMMMVIVPTLQVVERIKWVSVCQALGSGPLHHSC